MNPHYLHHAFKVFRKHYQLIPLEVYEGDTYKTLVSTILSARTRDETTLIVCERLFQKAPTIKTLVTISVDRLEKFLHPVGFYKAKAKNLSMTANILVKEYNGVIPSSREELIKLPGVGRKTANLVLSRAFNKPAISVDVHVHRLANLMGWVKTKDPEQTERALMEIIPQKYWKEINKSLVSLGRQFRSKRKLMEFLERNKLLIR